MSDIALELCHVWKKFKRGERFTSLRDLVPAVARRIVAREEILADREFWALRDVSFQMKRGEALGIIGPNGAGKSTILKLISGILRSSKGEIRLRGRLSALIEIGAGFHPDLTGRENIYLNGSILGMKKKEIDRKFDAIVEFSGLSEFIDTPVRKYSSGMYARLGFSVAAHVDPDILLVDEVLSVGDFSFQHKCVNKMLEFARNGTTIVFITHNIPSVNLLCPNTILLSQGEIYKYGRSRDVVRHYYRVFADTKKALTDDAMELKTFELYDRRRSASNSFRAGEWCKVKMEIESSVDVEDLVLGFFVKRNDGTVIFDMNSDKVFGRRFSFRAGERKIFEFDMRVNLPTGTYFVGVHLMDPGKGFCLYKDETAEFYVNGPMTMGYSFCDLRWEA